MHLIVKVTIFSLFILFYTSNTRAETHDQGTVKFIGTVINTPCSINYNTSEPTVSKKPLNILMEGCEDYNKPTIKVFYTQKKVEPRYNKKHVNTLNANTVLIVNYQ